MYRIAIVEDNPHLLRDLLRKPEKLEIVFTAINGEDFLLKLRNLPIKEHPEVVLMDINLPIMDGISAVREASLLYSAIQYIMLTVCDDDDNILKAINAGAHGYLLKEESIETIHAAISDVLDNQGSPMSSRIARKAIKLLARTSSIQLPKKQISSAILSNRELQILTFMVNGLNYKKIGEHLCISPFTVRNHIANIYGKLNITSKAEAIRKAMQNRWV